MKKFKIIQPAYINNSIGVLNNAFDGEVPFVRYGDVIKRISEQDGKCGLFEVNGLEMSVFYKDLEELKTCGDVINETRQSIEELEQEEANAYITFLVSSLLEDFSSSAYVEEAVSLAKFVEEKDRKYGQAFFQMCDEYGLDYAISKMHEKLSRMKQVVSLVREDESFEDSVKDLWGYALLTLLYLKEYPID